MGKMVTKYVGASVSLLGGGWAFGACVGAVCWNLNGSSSSRNRNISTHLYALGYFYMVIHFALPLGKT